MTEACAHVPDVSPCIVLAHRQSQRAEEWPSAAWGGEARDHDLLPLRGLHLQPVGGPAARGVRAVRALGHDAFEMPPFGFGEELLPIAFAVRAERDQLVVRQDGLEPFLSLEQRQLPQILAVREHEVERAVQELGFMA